MEDFSLLLIVIIAMALLFDYINGFHDAANAIATVVSSKALSPRWAVIYGAVLNFAGALMGTEVAATIGKGLVDSNAITLEVVLFALIAAIAWNLFTWWLGLPSSSSHALIGSVIGAGFFATEAGWNNVHWDKFLIKVVTPMFTSPVMGVIIGFALMAGLMWVFFRTHLSKINFGFSKMQLVSSGFLALSHGRNDAQKSMGIIALALILSGHTAGGEFVVPLWVKMSCATMMGLGTLTGGWKIIRTMSKKMIRLQPIYGFAAEATSAAIIMGASKMGIPLSTTQVISSSITGVGMTKRLSAVKWGVVKNILWAWILTIPITFFIAGMLTLSYRLITGG